MIKYLFITLLLTLIATHSIQFLHPIQPEQNFCYFENFHRDSKFIWEIKPMNDTKYELKVIISIDSINPYFHKITQFGKQKIKLSRMVPTSNRYTFCFKNLGAQQTYFRIRLAQGAEVMDYAVGPSKKDHHHLDMDVDDLERLSEQVKASVVSADDYHSQIHNKNLDISQTTIWICIISGIFIIVTNAFSFTSLKRFLRERKKV